MGGKKNDTCVFRFCCKQYDSTIRRLFIRLSTQRIANLELQIKGKTQEELSFNEHFLFKEDSVF